MHDAAGPGERNRSVLAGPVLGHPRPEHILLYPTGVH